MLEIRNCMKQMGEAAGVPVSPFHFLFSKKEEKRKCNFLSPLLFIDGESSKQQIGNYHLALCALNISENFGPNSTN